MSDLQQTQYGFRWGPLIVERDISDPKYGYVMTVFTGTERVEIRTSPKGRKLTVTTSKPYEYQREQWEAMQK